MQRYQEIIGDTEYQSMIKKIKEYEQNREYCCHTLEHFCDVARIMYILALEEGSELEQDIIYTTALLHDIGREMEYENGIPHEEGSVEFAKKLLPKYGFDKEEIEEITKAISLHRAVIDDENELAEYLYRADKLSRNCFLCKAKEKCKWTDDMKNSTLII